MLRSRRRSLRRRDRSSNKPVYVEKAKRALVELYKRRSKIDLVGEASHVGGGIDSYYEYVLKCSRLFGDKECESMWQTSIRALNKNLAEETPSGLWYGEVDMNNGKRRNPEFGALQAFLPAVLDLGGDTKRARRLE